MSGYYLAKVACAPEQDINMKFTYLGNFDSEVPTIDQDILYSLKKKGEVFQFDLRKFEDADMQKIIEKANESDMFLFHGFIPETNDMMLEMILQRVQILLDNIKCKKVLWFFDKIMGNKVKIITKLMDSVDFIFLNDDTWSRRFSSDKIFPLHHAAPEGAYIRNGEYKKELACDIAFVGSMYGERLGMYEFLKKKFGDRFVLYDDKFGKNYADLCKSAKIIFVPQHPFDDFYWSERIYTTLASGGFCFHPRSYGLEEEGFVDGKHYMTYHTEQDMFVALSMLLDKKSDKTREDIAKEGKKFVKGITYSQRLDEIIKHLPHETKSIQ